MGKKTSSLLTILSVTLFIGFYFIDVGYAAINSITSEISGNVTATLQKGIFIRDVTYASSVNANKNDSIINSYYQTMLDSKVVLSNKANSSITYNIRVFNNSGYDIRYYDTTYGQEFYDNQNIIYTVNGITQGQIVKNKETYSFSITFSYKDGKVATNNILNSYLNFRFKKLYTITYINIPQHIINANNYPIEIFDGIDYSINLTDVARHIKVSMNGKVLAENTDYTFSNNVLTVPKVNGNIIVEMLPSFTIDKGSNGFYLKGNTFPGKGHIVSEELSGHYYNVVIGIPKKGKGSGTYNYTLDLKNTSGGVWFFPSSQSNIVDAGGTSGNEAITSYTGNTNSWIVGNNKIMTMNFSVDYNITNNKTAHAQTIVTAGYDKFNLNISFIGI